jgi:hypothetical protein
MGRCPSTWCGNSEIASVASTLRSRLPARPGKRSKLFGLTDQSDLSELAINVLAMDTVLDRLLAAGISEDRAPAHLAAGTVRVDGQTVTDPQTPAPRPCRIVLRARRTELGEPSGSGLARSAGVASVSGAPIGVGPWVHPSARAGTNSSASHFLHSYLLWIFREHRHLCVPTRTCPAAPAGHGAPQEGRASG